MKWGIQALKTYPHWDLWLWGAWGLQFALYEFLGLDRVGNSVPLTWTVRDLIPLPIRAIGIAWLAWHFVLAGTNWKH